MIPRNAPLILQLNRPVLTQQPCPPPLRPPSALCLVLPSTTSRFICPPTAPYTSCAGRIPRTSRARAGAGALIVHVLLTAPPHNARLLVGAALAIVPLPPASSPIRAQDRSAGARGRRVAGVVHGGQPADARSFEDGVDAVARRGVDGARSGGVWSWRWGLGGGVGRHLGSGGLGEELWQGCCMDSLGGLGCGVCETLEVRGWVGVLC